MGQKIRFLLSRDDFYHQRGYWVLAKALSDGGIEVVLGGIQTPQDTVETAIEEDVDLIGYRIMNASPRILIQILFEKMAKRGIKDVPVVVGGIVPEKDEAILRGLGVKEVFHPFTPLKTILESVKTIAAESTKRQERI
ncbi:MAG: cobalamin-dependent protein [Desulfatiglans sp.]|jgi:methylmalonyl-CoA mutase C-terminal domain/subunit|nr:cobalamin-dependent protein [Thermodesulfobacteriota bacterium]MEE4353101.1 cobalamin-dependent protein [Desulfatiglans sp.]